MLGAVCRERHEWTNKTNSVSFMSNKKDRPLLVQLTPQQSMSGNTSLCETKWRCYVRVGTPASYSCIERTEKKGEEGRIRLWKERNKTETKQERKKERKKWKDKTTNTKREIPVYLDVCNFTTQRIWSCTETSCNEKMTLTVVNLA
jgi:hypothetical protein